MNLFIKKWKLGWSVFFRILLLYLILFGFSLLIFPLGYFLELSETWAKWARIPVILFYGILGLYLFPMVFYWAACITGYLKGSDEEAFIEIERLEKQMNRYGERDPWESDDLSESEQDRRGNGLPPAPHD